MTLLWNANVTANRHQRRRRRQQVHQSSPLSFVRQLVVWWTAAAAAAAAAASVLVVSGQPTPSPTPTPSYPYPCNQVIDYVTRAQLVTLGQNFIDNAPGLTPLERAILRITLVRPLQYDVQIVKVCGTCPQVVGLEEDEDNDNDDNVNSSNNNNNACRSDDYAYTALHSGLFVLPYDGDAATADLPLPGARPLHILCHGTLASHNNEQVPSNAWTPLADQDDDDDEDDPLPGLEALLGILTTSSAGVYTLLPDYLGYGESATSSSSSTPSPSPSSSPPGFDRSYLVRSSYGTATVPLIHAAQQFVASVNESTPPPPPLPNFNGLRNCALLVPPSISTQATVVSGYSEGGYAAVAIADVLHRQQGHEILQVFASAGPYRLSSAQLGHFIQASLDGTLDFDRRYFLALLGVAFSSTTTSVVNYNQNADLLNSSVRNLIVETVRDASDVTDDALNALVPLSEPLSIWNSALVQALINAIAQDGTENPCATILANANISNDDPSKLICTALANQDLIDIIESTPYPVNLCHSTEDRIFPTSNLPDDAAVQANAANLEITLVDGDHFDAAVNCAADTIIPFFLTDPGVPNDNFPPVPTVNTAPCFPSASPTVLPTVSPTVAPSDDRPRLVVVEVIAQTFVLGLQEAYLGFARLTSRLSASSNGDRPFTALTPWDAAWNGLQPRLIRKLQNRSWAAHLQDLLNYHLFVDDGLTEDDLLAAASTTPPTTLRMANDEDVTVSQREDGRLLVNDVLVLGGFNCADGYLHLLGGVLRPAWMSRTLDEIPGTISFLSVFADAVVSVGLDRLLARPNESLTVFAPNNDAFGENFEASLDIVRYHIATGGPYPSLWASTGTLPTLNGQDLQLGVTRQNNVVTSMTVQGPVNQANVILRDFSTASNGLVHVIDAVLLLE